MTLTSTEQERADFEVWYEDRYGFRDYTKAIEVARRADAWEVWQASRRAQVVPQLEPVEGDQLPPVGSRIFIRHGRDDDAHACIVTGYYVWGDLKGDKRLHRVFVRMVYEGTQTQNARMLCDCYKTEAEALTAAHQPPEVAQLDDINVADMAQAIDSKDSAHVPKFNHAAKRKLELLQGDGANITGYAIEKDGRRGAIDCHGFVYWWNDEAAPKTLEAAKAECWCLTCRPLTLQDMRFVICPDCGNKRCPKANNHANACTNSNAPGQKGSSWEHVKPIAEAAQVQLQGSISKVLED